MYLNIVTRRMLFVNSLFVLHLSYHSSISHPLNLNHIYIVNAPGQSTYIQQIAKSILEMIMCFVPIKPV